MSSPHKVIINGSNVLVVSNITWLDPLVAFEPFCEDSLSILLHGNGQDVLSRWSYIGTSPFSFIDIGQDLKTKLNGVIINEDPFKLIKSKCINYKNTISESPAPFYGGAIGFIGYEINQIIEEIPNPKNLDSNSIMSVGFYDIVVAFDRYEKKTYILSSGLPEKSKEDRIQKAKSRIDYILKVINQTKESVILNYTSKWNCVTPRFVSEKTIGKAIKYIYDGDISQVNITHKFKCAKPERLKPWHLYRKLRKLNPSPFGAYLSINKNYKILSSSPERFLNLDSSGVVETRPIKGSQKRSNNNRSDKIYADELKKSQKDISENLMIVDLMRNDLSRVCEPGSIKVTDFCKLESFAEIHHLVSVIIGKLKKENHASDLLRVCFPGGSITGTPKVRAMQIINELESEPRGAYCGTVFWMGFDGALDSSITIRSIVINENEIIAQGGGAIVSDSNPHSEYEETILKIHPLLKTLEDEI